MWHCRLLDSIHEITPELWDRLFAQANGATPYPFLRHAFLAALEDSGCTDIDTGWQPQHLLLENADGEIVAAMPLYLKHHSYGEYVFDWSWADAYRRNGLAYYPKLLSAAPFTPATGPRLGLAEAMDKTVAIEQMTGFLDQHCEQRNLSGWHLLFLPPNEAEPWQAAGNLTRVGCQFHWKNRDYRNFDDFLSTFNSRKRKSVKKERRGVRDAGVTLTRLVGDEITASDWDRFYRFYHTTYLKRSGNTGYLNREFFEAIATRMGHQILMVNAEQGSDGVIASALCFFDDQQLYGRYWGCRNEIPGLHFEACYYQGIEFAIERGLQIFDPGAQGEHKIQRGFEPTLTYSQHWLAEPAFHEAVADFLRRETPGIKAYRDDCASYLPFRQEPS